MISTQSTICRLQAGVVGLLKGSQVARFALPAPKAPKAPATDDSRPAVPVPMPAASTAPTPQTTPSAPQSTPGATPKDASSTKPRQTEASQPAPSASHPPAAMTHASPSASRQQDSGAFGASAQSGPSSSSSTVALSQRQAKDNRLHDNNMSVPLPGESNTETLPTTPEAAGSGVEEGQQQGADSSATPVQQQRAASSDAAAAAAAETKDDNVAEAEVEAKATVADEGTSAAHAEALEEAEADSDPIQSQSQSELSEAAPPESATAAASGGSDVAVEAQSEPADMAAVTSPAAPDQAEARRTNKEEQDPAGSCTAQSDAQLAGHEATPGQAAGSDTGANDGSGPEAAPAGRQVDSGAVLDGSQDRTAPQEAASGNDTAVVDESSTAQSAGPSPLATTASIAQPASEPAPEPASAQASEPAFQTLAAPAESEQPKQKSQGVQQQIQQVTKQGAAELAGRSVEGSETGGIRRMPAPLHASSTTPASSSSSYLKTGKSRPPPSAASGNTGSNEPQKQATESRVLSPKGSAKTRQNVEMKRQQTSFNPLG